MVDVIIIGKGPSGISLAIYLQRSSISTLVIGKGFGALEKAEKIENFYGNINAVSGKDLVELGILQAENLGVKIVSEEVLSIDQDEYFLVKTNSNTYAAKAVVFATGKSRNKPLIKNINKYEGKGVSFCAVCDGFFYRNKKIAVIGNGDYAIEEANVLTNFTKEITIFTNGLSMVNNNHSYNVVTEKITEVYGEDTVEGIATETQNYNVDGIFVALGTAGAATFARKMGIRTENDDIVVDENYMTNIDGIFAIGDCIGGFLQVAKAVSDGAISSKSIISFIKGININQK